MASAPAAEVLSSGDGKSPELSTTETPPVPAVISWHGGPRMIGPGRLESLAMWTWDVFLTLSPLCFFALAITTLRLNGKPISEHGERIVNLTQLGPTVYPIVFAAVAGRFFKNFARWRLEAEGGIRLSTLEQVHGSQTLAGSLERLLFVRTQVLVAALILLVWGLSPLGGQSAVRLLRMGEAAETVKDSVWFKNPHWQSSMAEGASSWFRAKVSSQTLYTSSLLASAKQKGSPVDLWGLPKIPQWPKSLEYDAEHLLDHGGQEALARGEEYYTSLLGVQVQGLVLAESKGQYDFTVEKLYYDFQCTSVQRELPIEKYSDYLSDPQLNLTQLLSFSINDNANPRFSTFALTLVLPNSTETLPELASLRDAPPSHVQYATVDRSEEHFMSHFALFDCTARPVVVDTTIRCNASLSQTDCWATRQKRADDRYNASLSNLLGTDSAPSTRLNLLDQWRIAEGPANLYDYASTDKYIAGSLHPFAPVEIIDWSQVPLEEFSKRLTTAFNTFWEATQDPFNHTTVDFPSRPDVSQLQEDATRSIKFLAETDAVVTIRHEVYRVNRLWAGLLIITTTCLQVLALAGLVLELFIHGPDILGFASSLTRENPYVGLPPGGSALDGPARARALKGLRVQLADVDPNSEVGYLSLRTVSQDDAPTRSWKRWKPSSSTRFYR